MRALWSLVSARSFWNWSDFHHANDDCPSEGAASATRRSAATRWLATEGLMRKPLKILLLEGIRRGAHMYLMGDKVLRGALGVRPRSDPQKNCDAGTQQLRGQTPL